MAGMWKYRKIDLKSMAEELEIEILATDKIANIIDKIKNFEGFEENAILSQLEIIKEDREILEESERLKEAEERRLATEKLRLEEEERKRKHEIEVLKLQQLSETGSLVSQSSETKQNINLKQIMQKFDPNKTDISVFLALFERQARKIKIPEDQWVSQLLAFIPVEMAEIIIRENEEETESYAFVKKLLLDRFKLTPEILRTKFFTHNKKPDEIWRDLLFDLRNYLEHWLDGIGVEDFESLKKLMIAEQIKKRAPHELKDHLIDKWTTLIDPEVVVKQFDDYEAVRRPNIKNSEKKGFDKNHKSEKHKDEREGQDLTVRGRNKDDRSKVFDKRKEPTCYECNSKSHLRQNCPKLIKADHLVNHIMTGENLSPTFAPYLSTAKVNGRDLNLIRDTGTEIDILSIDHITPKDLTGERVYLKGPLEARSKSYSLANICIENIDFGKIYTQAAIAPKGSGLTYYLLGNRTFEKIQRARQYAKEREKARTKAKQLQSSRGVENSLDKAQNEQHSKIILGEDKEMSSLQELREEGCSNEIKDDSLEGISDIDDLVEVREIAEQFMRKFETYRKRKESEKNGEQILLTEENISTDLVKRSTENAAGHFESRPLCYSIAEKKGDIPVVTHSKGLKDLSKKKSALTNNPTGNSDTCKHGENSILQTSCKQNEGKIVRGVENKTSNGHSKDTGKDKPENRNCTPRLKKKRKERYKERSF